ncbi:MAG: hypothetical protein B6D59_04285, partial [Campylobacteraceae bacterium 4484_4]
VKGSKKVVFDLISRRNTLKDTNGNYKDRGHYEILTQAKDSKNHLPVSGLEDAAFTLYENGIKHDEAKIRVHEAPKEVENQILLLLDFSDSVIGDCDQVQALYQRDTGRYIVQNVEEVKEDNLCYKLITSAEHFVDKTVDNGQKMAIFYFNSKVEITALVTSTTASTTGDVELLKQGLEKLYDPQFRRDNLEGYDSTNLFGAVIEATKTACHWVDNCNYDNYTPSKEIDKSKLQFASIVVFTDGRDQAQRETEDEMLDFIQRHNANFYYTIGLGDVNRKVLSQIGKDGFEVADNLGELDTKFSQLGNILNAWGSSFYRIEYCPAQQEGKVDIRIDVKDPVTGEYGSITDRITLPQGVDIRCDL